MRSEKCLQRRGAAQVGLLRAFLFRPPPPAPPRPSGWLSSFVAASRALRPPSHASSPISTSGRATRALSCLPAAGQRRAAPGSPRARRAAAAPLRSAPVPSSPSPFPPSSGGRSRTWAPRGAPPPPRRRRRQWRLPPGPGARSAAAFPPRFICCCSPSLPPSVPPSLRLSPFLSPPSELLSPRRCADEDFLRGGRLASPPPPPPHLPPPCPALPSFPRPRCRSPCGPWSR